MPRGGSAGWSGNGRISIFLCGAFGAVAMASAAAAQQQQQQQQQQSSDWFYSAGASVHYDTFESDDGLIESDQVSELFSFTAGRENMWQDGDSFSISTDFGFIQAWPERGGARDFAHATPMDVFISADYSTWDNQTSGYTVNLFVNLPTGPNDFNLVELAAIPNPNVVSASILSSGLQIGGEAEYHQRVEEWHWYAGLGYTFRSGINGFDTFSVEELAGGHDVTALAGADYQINQRWNVGLDANYTYSFEEEGTDNHYFSATVPVTYLFERGEVSLSYSFSYSTSENRELTRQFRGIDEMSTFLEGLRHRVSLETGYKVSDPFVVRGLAEVSLGKGARTSDPAFFSTDDFYRLGIGGSYTVAPNLDLEGWVKYFEVSTRGAAGGSTTFEGASATLGLNYSF